MIVDTAQIGSTRSAPGGGLIVSARIGRSGVQVYRRPDGSTVRAFRPADEVRGANFAGAPVTVGHPSGGVTPVTYQQHAVGHVQTQDSNLERVGRHEYARAELLLAAAPAIEDAQSGKIAECSCAYSCDQIWGAGIADGEEYDVTFKAIVPNHVALGPKGFARAGAEARIVADGTDGDWVLIEDAPSSENYPRQERDGADMDQKEHDLLVADHAALKIKYDSLVAEHEALKGRAAAADGKLATLQAQVDGLPKAIADGVASELAFREALRGRLPAGYDATGKSPRALKIAAIKHAQPKAEIADSASDEYVDAYFAATAPAVTVHDHNSDVRTDVQDAKPSSYEAHMRAESARLFSGK